ALEQRPCGREAGYASSNYDNMHERRSPGNGSKRITLRPDAIASDTIFCKLKWQKRAALTTGKKSPVALPTASQHHRARFRAAFPAGQPPVTLMWRATAGRLCARSMTKSCPLGL